jgi:hypothetical protein
MIPMHRSRSGLPLADLMQDCTVAESAATGLALSLPLPVAVSISTAHATRPAFAATTLIAVPSIVPFVDACPGSRHFAKKHRRLVADAALGQASMRLLGRLWAGTSGDRFGLE